MKRLILTSLISICAIALINAQKLDPSSVPSVVKSKFSSLYPKASNVNWGKEDNDFEINFMDGKTKMSAIIDAKGTYKETETEMGMDTSSLPKAIPAYMAKNYATYTVKGYAKIVNAEGIITYEAAVKKDKKSIDVIFDSTGNFLKEDKD